MKLNRDLTKFVNWTLDNLLPPLLRDCRGFMYLIFYPLFGKKTRFFMDFKEKGWAFTNEEFRNYYILLSDKHIKPETDLNKKSVDLIIENHSWIKSS